MKFFKKGKSSATALLSVLAVALITALAIIAYFSMTTVYVFVANKTIPEGTKITAELVKSGALVQKEINKTFFKDIGENYIVTDANSLIGQYIQSEQKKGKILYSYDVASRYDIRTNPYLQDNKFEAFTLSTGSFTSGKATNLLEKGDRINIYAVYTLDLSALKTVKQYEANTGFVATDDFGSEDSSTIANAYGIKVSELPTYAQDICLASGMNPEDFIYEDEITLAKLMWQNVPIINVTKTEADNAANTNVSEIIIGVDSKTAEQLLILMEKGKIGCTLLPYTDGEYTAIDNTGSTDFAINNFGKVFTDAQVTE